EGRGSWWQMPQGGIDPDEDPRKAALRELEEETGIHTVEFVAEHPEWLRYDLPPSLIGKAWGGRWRGQRQEGFLLRFLGDDSEVSLRPPSAHQPEVDALRWALLDELPALIVPFERDVYAKVISTFAPLIKPIDSSS